ncbi:MAG: folate family ECF transporter S component [Limnochordia bacterium]|jgi:ECF transporter S component (folate family)|nr:folate family ECF transporter S component [Limnochordia bacterium]MDD2629514.1 folate family ECF transporter S component [Limnochordia bacterium]MDD4517927.1 folate family ECF transporter S component [Limnochordia bacterium]
MSNYSKYRTTHLVIGSLLSALSIVATRFLSFQVFIGGIGAVRLGFGPLPIIFAGLLLGPLWGGAVGFIADTLGFFVNPMGGGFLPPITLIAILRGVIPGLLVKVCSRRGKRDALGTVLAIALTQVITGLVLTPLVLWRFLGVPLIANVPIRLAAQVILIPVYSIVSLSVMKSMSLLNNSTMQER